jgi:hypothetical protein
MQVDEELHEQIMQAFREYFKANQRLVNEGTKRACMDTRFWLHRIRELGLERRKHLMDWRKWKDQDWEEKKQARRQARENKRVDE